MKLLNFRIDGINIETAGQIFDLHNYFKLRGYNYDTWNGIYEIALQGHLFVDDSELETNKITTDLKIIFRNVSCLRIHERSFDEKNVCFDGMQYVSQMKLKPDIANQLEEYLSEHGDITTPIDSETAIEPASDGKIAPIDWNNYIYIDFTWGVEILIAAETVEVSFHQSITNL
jgi:hypothetical protein